MAQVMALGHSRALLAITSENNNRSCPSVASQLSARTVQHNILRSSSAHSLSSNGSYLISSSYRKYEHNPTVRPASSVCLSLTSLRHSGDQTSTTHARRSSLTTNSDEHLRNESLEDSARSDLGLADVAENEDEKLDDNEQKDEIDDSRSTEPDRRLSHLHVDPAAADENFFSSELSPNSSKPQTFRRWISKLRRRKQGTPATLTPRQDRFVLDDFDHVPISSPARKRSSHAKSDSQNSSLGFVTAIRSATATLASASVATMSRRTSRWRRGQQRSSLLSGSDHRPSVDSQQSVMDEAAKQRSRKRREKLEELIRTEESYVADIKALSDAYFTLLGHQPTSASFARPSAQRTIGEILHIHDDILGHLYRVVPFAEYDQCVAKAQDPAFLRTHARWHSADVVPTTRAAPVRSILATVRHHRRSLNIRRSSEDEPLVLQCSPQTAAEVAKIFASHLHDFSAYEEFGANYELVQRDIDETQRSIPTWADFDKAIEVLAAHVNPTRSWQANHKKAMTVKDLLIKPIQRLPRYELLFNDLVKLTPVCDDPVAYTVLEETRMRLSDTCRRMNEAKDNPGKTKAMQTTWLIGERLSFSAQVPRSVFLQLLGEVALCGCLHVAYRTRDRIRGAYVVCILFETTLLLASANEEQVGYSILAGIALAKATVEETDNLKGLQCHTAPHSWKVVFEHSTRMYEVIMTACSAVEADVWRAHINQGVERQSRAVAIGAANVFELQSPLLIEMRSIGKAFGKAGSFVRRMSVHRTATVGPTSDLNQVIIKNTQAVKEVQDGSSQQSLHIPRSQSVATPSHVQTLAPRRVDRYRLETILADVWTRELLPYPGMLRRSDPLRASANHVIRKFSMASIASNFSSAKRTGSYTSIASSRKEDLPPLKAKSSFGDSLGRRSNRSVWSPVVNFQTAPDAFLPADFELENTVAKRKKLGLRSLTMTIDRPFTPVSRSETKQASLRRAQSVRASSPHALVGAPPQAISCLRESGYPTTRPVYSTVPARVRTPASLQAHAGVPQLEMKTPRKSKSIHRLLRLFG